MWVGDYIVEYRAIENSHEPTLSVSHSILLAVGD